MKVNALTLDDEGLPDTVTVTMTRKEATFLTKVTGGQSRSGVEVDYPGYGEVSENVYYGFAASVFNRYWDNGVDGAYAGERQ